MIGVSLGTPPVFPDRAEPLILQGPSLLAVSGLSVNPSEREASRAFYFAYYENASKPPITWTGDVGTCNAGDTAAAFKDAVMLRINYFRAMAGVPAAVAWDPTYSTKAQAAALIMAANGSLSHDPPASWKCYSAEGDEAAGKSNLSLGRYGWDAISGYMEDWGPNNGYVGHRRWVLYPQTQTMGTGDIPPGSSSAANALWVFDRPLQGAPGRSPPVKPGYMSFPGEVEAETGLSATRWIPIHPWRRAPVP